MGRPKKGELSYRKPVKKNGIKPLMKSYDKHMMGSNRSSLSSEYDQDDVSTPDDVFNSMSAGQHHQIAPAHQQLGSHLHQQQPQHLQQQQQQQSGSFSLGSILHDCMTVQDWDQKMDMSEMDHDGQRGQAQSLVITPASASSGNMMDDGRQVSPHNMRHTSPTIHSDLIAQQMQQRQQQQQQLRHNQQLQLPHQPQGQQDVKQLERQYVVSYQDPRQSSGNMDVMSSIEYPNEHDLPVNRPIKVENVSLQDGPGSAFGESVVLEDMQNLQSINKTEFSNYQLQGLDPNSPYNVGEQRTATSTPTSGSTLVPISQLEPSVSSQIVAINMSSQNVYYTPHSHNEPIIIRNMNLPQQTLAPTQNHQGLEQNHVDPDLKSSSNDSAMNRGQDISNELFSSGNYHIIKSDGTIRVAHQPQAMSSNSQGHASVLQQQFISDSDSGQHSGRSRKLRDINESDFTILTPSGQQAVTSVPSSLAVSSSSNIHPKISGIKSPIAAILQQHRDAIQAGRPVQLSSEEIEELLNSVNAEQARTQRILDNEQLILKGQNVVDDPNIVDLRRQPMDNFMALNDPHQNESGISYRNTPPNAGRTFPHSSPSSQYQSNSPGIQSMTQIQRRPYTNQISPTSEPGGGEKQDYGRAYGIITSVANNNNNNNNNNNSQISHYISSSPSPPHVGHHGNRSPPDEIFDDSFNSALIRDSTLLHEINRIFLGIDNSCETYGCHRRNDNDVDKEINNKSVMMGCLSPDAFSPEVSHKYWHSFKPSERFVEMTAERQKIIQAVLDAFDNLQRTYATNEPEYVNKKMSHDQLEHWHLIQRRIARHVVAGQRFCRNIPGYFKLDIQDRISLGKHVGFGLMVLIACTEFYDPEFKRFRYIWNWTMPMQNPLFSYKVHLLSLGNRIHEIEMDRTEASMLCAISMTSIDCPGLVKPEIVCEVRDGLIDALQAHISVKTESTQRLKKLLSFMPQVRLMTVWYNNLMKKMSLPSDIINSKISKPLARGSTEVENAASFS